MAYGIVNGMEIRIDKAGRIVVVPKPLRERLGFKPETELEAIEQPEAVFSSGSKTGIPCLRSMDCGSIRVARNRGQTGSVSLETCAKSRSSPFWKR